MGPVLETKFIPRKCGVPDLTDFNYIYINNEVTWPYFNKYYMSLYKLP